jgi:hypothetical protein
MKLRFKSAVAGVSALAIASAGLAFAGSASAYTGTGTAGAPIWTNTDTANIKGSVLILNASGAQVTGGNNIAAIGSFLATSAAARSGATNAQASVAAPDPTNVLPATWATNTLPTNNYAFTANTLPAGAPAGAAWVALTTSGANIPARAGAVVLYPTMAGANSPANDANYKNVLELRIQDSGATIADDGQYFRTVIEYVPAGGAAYDGLTAGQWKVIYPAVTTTTTTTTVTGSTPSGTQVGGTSVTFQATVTGASTGGTVDFYDGNPASGGTLISSNAYTGGTVSSTATTTLSVATHSIYAKYVPAAFSIFSGSTSAAFSFQVTTPPAIATTTTLGVIAGSNASDLCLSDGGAVPCATQPSHFTGSAIVTPAGAAAVGSVSFFADSSTTAFATDASAPFTFDVASSGFGAGPHTIFAVYSGTSGLAQDYLTSTSGTGSIRVVSGQVGVSDTQYIQTQINPGTITITTPYNGSGVCATDALTGLPVSGTPCGRLVLPAMSLDSTATGYTTSGAFNNIAILDERPGNLPYDVYAVSSPLTRVGGASTLSGTESTIDSHNVGLTSVGLDTITPFAVNNSTGVKTFTNNIAADYVAPGAIVFPAGHFGLGGTGQKVINNTHGLGTTTILGTLTIHAPTNTVDGTYIGTITFSAFAA